MKDHQAAPGAEHRPPMAGHFEGRISGPIDSHPESRVHNSQPEGIGRVVALDGLCAWNNLGRNVVFADTELRILAVFDETRFPDDDEPSQYDLDIHAIVDLPGSGHIATLNHLGDVRVFGASDIRRSGPVRSVRPLFTLEFVADVERAVVVGGQLVGSQPRSLRAGGVLVSEPLTPRGARGAGPLGTDVRLERHGEVTALGAFPSLGNDVIAMGGEGWVSLVSPGEGPADPPRWKVAIGFRAAGFMWDGALLWAAGSEISPATIDDYDWEQRRGGGFAGLDPADGSVVVAGEFTRDPAWGTGGVAVAKAPGVLLGVGRRGELCLFDPIGGQSIGTSPPLASHSLGIAHAAVVGDRLVYGWNRGGYRLHTCSLSPTAASEAGAGNEVGRRRRPTSRTA